MVEAEFERGLERLFADGPELPDASAFADRVQRRLATGWTARRWLIGAAGVAGGLVGVSQLLVSNFAGQLAQASDSARTLGASVGHLGQTPDISQAIFSGGATVWVARGTFGEFEDPEIASRRVLLFAKVRAHYLKARLRLAVLSCAI